MRTIVATLLFAVTAPVALGCQLINIQPDDPVQNPRFTSENGRYTVVVRVFPQIGDFGSLPASAVMDFSDAPVDAPPPPPTAEAALYDGSTLVATFSVPRDSEEIAIPNDGRTIVVFAAYQRGFSILRTDGSVVANITPEDLFVPDEAQSVREWKFRVSTALHHDDASGRDVIGMFVPVSSKNLEAFDEVRVDAETGEILDAKRDLLPKPRVWITSSSPLLDYAFDAPLPEYATIALKARIRGVVIAEVSVSDVGEVTNVRVLKPLPFELHKSVVKAVSRWHFKRHIVDGRLTPFTLPLTVHFDVLNDREWEEAVPASERGNRERN